MYINMYINMYICACEYVQLRCPCCSLSGFGLDTRCIRYTRPVGRNTAWPTCDQLIEHSINGSTA